ncbi:equilibrative nucleobase transporter 1-like [Clytia hemisphaerica]|uniref:Uncharacterized protein n=1 Tax=Clytia hemisphaerica TaxID=252671 RepID=A0A7M5UHF2_9CNID
MTFADINNTCYLVSFFIFGMLETLLCSGITYGWASIVYVFKTEYFYMHLCEDWYAAQNKSLPTPKTRLSAIDFVFKSNPVNTQPGEYPIVRGGAAYIDDGKLPGCPAQDARLNLIFTVSLFCLCGIKFPAGIFIDKCGPRIARAVGGTMYILACIGLGFVSVGYEDILFGVFAMICMGGSLLVVSVYQVSNIIFRQARSRIICILHGAFDSSAVMLLIFKMIYDHGIQYRYIMFGYTLICLVLILIGTFVLIPRLYKLFQWIEEEARLQGYYAIRRDSFAGPDFVVRSLGWENYAQVTYEARRKSRTLTYGSTNDSIGSIKEENGLANSYEDHNENVDVWEGENEPLVNQNQMSSKSHKRFGKGSVLNSILSPLYLFELIYLIGFQLKLWYFVGSMADFLGRLTLNDKTLISQYVDIFGYVQFGGILVTPLIGLVFDKDRLTGKDKEIMMMSAHAQRIKKLSDCIAPFAVTNILCMIFCVTSAIENLHLQVVSFVLYAIVRGFLYSNHGAYMGAAFPASQFGTLYGLGIFIGGTFGIFQYVLFKITSGPLHGDPFWVNMFLLALVSIGNIHPLYLWWYCRKQKKNIQWK